MSETENKVKRCKETHCKVHIDGKCMDLLDVDKGECKNFYLADASADEVQQATQKEVKKQAGIGLFEGKEMEMHEITEVTHKFPSKIVAIVGESDCGKTTLLAELYNIFQKGPHQDLLFAGSHTLVGFERRSHLSRVESNSENPETGKTVSRVFSFLHLALKKKPNLEEDAVHILLSDISGERFQFARDSSSIMKELGLLTDAEQVIYIVDGEKLANKRLRQQTLSNADTFLQNATDNGILNGHTHLTVVLSKWDKLANDGTFNFEQQMKVPFEAKFSPRVKSMKVYPIAARPKSPGVSAGFGLYELLNDCYLVKKEALQTGPQAVAPVFGREFYQLKTRSEHE